MSPAADVNERSSSDTPVENKRRLRRRRRSSASSPPPPLKSAVPADGGTPGFFTQLGGLFVASHPLQAVLTALALGATALMANRPTREAVLIAGIVLIGQAILGWHNDIIDRRRDARLRALGKPIAEGRLTVENACYAIAIGALALAPLAVATGRLAAIWYALSLVIAMLGSWLFKRTWLSWLPWAGAFACYPPFIALGGWGGADVGANAEPAVIALSAALGVSIHFMLTLPGLVHDNAEGDRNLPLRVARKIGTPILLILTMLCILGAGIGLIVATATFGIAA